MRRLADTALVIGLVLVGAGGWQLAQRVGSPPAPVVATTTLHRTHVIHRTRLVTVRVHAKVLERQDHYVTILVPRTIIRTRGHTYIVRRHVERIRANHRSYPVTAAVVRAAPVTVTVPVTVFLPGPTQTVTAPPTTVTVPVTITGPTTTITVPGLSDSSSVLARRYGGRVGWWMDTAGVAVTAPRGAGHYPRDREDR